MLVACLLVGGRRSRVRAILWMRGRSKQGRSDSNSNWRTAFQHMPWCRCRLKKLNVRRRVSGGTSLPQADPNAAGDELGREACQRSHQRQSSQHVPLMS